MVKIDREENHRQTRDPGGNDEERNFLPTVRGNEKNVFRECVEQGLGDERVNIDHQIQSENFPPAAAHHIFTRIKSFFEGEIAGEHELVGEGIVVHPNDSRNDEKDKESEQYKAFEDEGSEKYAENSSDLLQVEAPGSGFFREIREREADDERRKERHENNADDPGAVKFLGEKYFWTREFFGSKTAGEEKIVYGFGETA